MKNKFLPAAILLIATASFIITGCGKGDNEAPKITLNGSSNMTVYKGDAFVDPGVSATDNVDGDMTSQIVTTGAVGTSVGHYTISYKVTDKAGNYMEVSRFVTVKYKNQYLAGTYNVVETSPFGTVTYTGSVTSGTSDDAEFVFGSTTAPDPIVVDATIIGVDQINVILAAQGGPLNNYSGTISEPSGPVVFTMSYLRPINSTTTNCTATWTKQ